SDVEHDDPRRRQVPPGCHALAGDDPAAERREDLAERRRDCPGATAREGPADGVAEHAHHESERRAAERVERDHGVRRESREERTRRLAPKSLPGKRARAPQAKPAEARQAQWVARRDGRREESLEECVRVFDEGTEQVVVRFSVRTERGGGGVEGSLEQDRAVVEWMSDGRRRVQPLETELLERQRSKERR